MIRFVRQVKVASVYHFRINKFSDSATCINTYSQIMTLIDTNWHFLKTSKIAS